MAGDFSQAPAREPARRYPGGKGPLPVAKRAAASHWVATLQRHVGTLTMLVAVGAADDGDAPHGLTPQDGRQKHHRGNDG